jgi:hypothetical protein
VKGKVEVVSDKDGTVHTGLTMSIDGAITLDPGGLRLTSTATITTQLLVQSLQIAPAGKLYVPPLVHTYASHRTYPPPALCACGVCVCARVLLRVRVRVLSFFLVGATL